MFVVSPVSSSSVSWGKPRPSSTMVPAAQGRSLWVFIAIQWLYCHLVTEASARHRAHPGIREPTALLLPRPQLRGTCDGPSGPGASAAVWDLLRPASATALPVTSWALHRDRSSDRPLAGPRSLGLSPGNGPSSGAGCPRWAVHPAPERHLRGHQMATAISSPWEKCRDRLLTGENPSEMYSVLEALSVLRQTPGSAHKAHAGGPAECSSRARPAPCSPLPHAVVFDPDGTWR